MILLVTTLAITYVYAFLTGFSDASNAVATGIGSRVLTPRQALRLAAVFELIGALSGTAVALTITKGIADVDILTFPLVLGALIATISWSFFTYIFGIPVSETHGLVGGVVGATIATVGAGLVIWDSVLVVLLAIVASPALGVSVGYFLTRLVNIVAYRTSHRIGTFVFRNFQIFTAGLLSFSHGLNDAQKPMGMATMALIVWSGNSELGVPYWVTISMAFMVSFGVFVGGERIIRTLGLKIVKLTPYYGSLSQVTASAVLNLASTFGIPISTTHTMTASLVGVSMNNKGSTINWNIISEIVLSWVLTVPVTIVLGFCVAWLLQLVI